MYKPNRLTTLVLLIALSLTASVAFAASEGKVVNINEADASDLALLPRVGPALSARIVEFREENGKFEAAEDLMLVRGIGEKTFELMEAFVAISGDTTLTEKIRVSDLERRKESKKESKGSEDDDSEK
ncbi:MAG: helix-hairpin-helix domain-containing protein [bacterium]|nr:helix-hairpin-helix domain-containing protein [bacterium]